MSLIEDILKDLPAPAGNVNKPALREYLANREIVSIKDLGAVGDGIADDTAQIQAVLDAHRCVYWPAGRYKITDRIDHVFPDYIVQIWDEGALLDAREPTAQNSLYVSGQAMPVGGYDYIFNPAVRAGGVALGADVGRKSRTIQITETDYDTLVGLGLTHGSILRLASSDLFTPAYAAAYKGEMVEFRSASVAAGNATLTLTGQLMDSYTAATTKVFIVPGPTVILKGVNILRDGDTHVGLAVSEAKHLYMENCRVSGAREQAMGVYYIFSGVNINGAVNDALGGTNSYAMAIASCQRFTQIGGNYTDARHGCVIGGYDPSRHITFLGGFYDCGSTGTAPHGFDTHGNCEYVTVIGAHIRGGAIVNGRNLIWANNTVEQDQANFGMQVFFQTDSEFTKITGGEIRSGGGYGHIYLNTEDDNLTCDEIVIDGVASRGEISVDNHGALWVRPSSAAGTGWRIKRLLINGSSFNGDGSVLGAGIFVSDHNGTLSADSPRIDFMGINNCYASAENGLYLLPATTSGVLRVNGGRFFSDQDSATLGGAIFGFDDIGISGNPHFEDFDVGTCIRMAPGSRLAVDSATMKGWDSNGGIELDTGTYLARLDNIEHAGSSGSFLINNAGATIIDGALRGSATWDPGSLADGVGETSAGITVTGAAFGDAVEVGAPYDLQGITCNGYVSAANTVKIRLQNETVSTIDLGSGTWKVAVRKAP